MTKNITTQKIAANGIIAAIYFVLTLLSYPIAFGEINFRISEFLVLLCFWRPDFVIGITLGCFLSNTVSTLGPIDMLFGTLATFFSCLFVAFSPKLLVATIFPIAINAFIVGFELNYVLGLPFWATAGYVAIGEGTVILVSYALWMILWRNKSFMAYLSPSRKEVQSW